MDVFGFMEQTLSVQSDCRRLRSRGVRERDELEERSLTHSPAARSRPPLYPRTLQPNHSC